MLVRENMGMCSAVNMGMHGPELSAARWPLISIYMHAMHGLARVVGDSFEILYTLGFLINSYLVKFKCTWHL